VRGAPSTCERPHRQHDWQIAAPRLQHAEVRGCGAHAICAVAWRSPTSATAFALIEQALETCCRRFGAIEMEATGDAERPFICGPWTRDHRDRRHLERRSRHAALRAVAQCVRHHDRRADTDPAAGHELMYLRLNPRTHIRSAGRLEVAFETVNHFSRQPLRFGLASNSVVQYALWLNRHAEQHDRLIRWWTDEIEGTGASAAELRAKPEVLRLPAGRRDSHPVQEFLLMMIANAFELRRSVGLQAESTDPPVRDGRRSLPSAVVPVAKLLAEHITRDLFAKKLGWRESNQLQRLETRDEMEECRCTER